MHAVTVLIIDDNENVLAVYSQMLATLGCKVICSDHVHAGLRLMEETVPRPDFVFLDLNFPGSDAKETARCIPEFQRLNPLAYTIVFTGMTKEKVEKMQTLLSGANALRQKLDLTKAEDFWATLEEAIERGKEMGIPPYEVTTKVIKRIAELRKDRGAQIREA
jgi:response regulator RpfG family c-di-GMP phosphodiesterase